MSNLLHTLADDWHKPNPYYKLIESVVPSSPYKFKIEDILLGIYVDEHHGKKLYRNSSKYTLYDMDIERAEFDIKKLKADMKREEDNLEKLCKKMEELQKFLDGTEDQEEEEEEEEEEEQEEVSHRGLKLEKSRQPKTMSGKEAEKQKKLEEQKNLRLAKSTKSAMATCQEKLMDMGEKFEILEKKKYLYTEYRKADWFYQDSMKQIVLKYDKSQDIVILIQDINTMYDEYQRLKKRVTPREPCQGEGKDLCKIHYLPLYLTVLSNEGFKHVWKCHASP